MKPGTQEPQDWQTDSYKGMEVHVCALRHDEAQGWDYAVRIAQPGEDASYESELAAESGHDAHLPTREKAFEAGFAEGYAMVDRLLQ
ncbi:hypothetical protein [Noviherbaspirillum galbum]|uniref:Uncharacterized protein n=1 Tax=Noviherbaspirillum galbum TaxID=2709383 RepID=A0A6B3SSI8_9BURK|nr:hypothetical protein [Noviherbaspirillum galbum]NEX62315.1 hypothetical protein [Noviherbaspirillum galbum]